MPDIHKQSKALALATLLDGRTMAKEITPDEAAQAKADGLVVAFGVGEYSVEFTGAFTGFADIGDGEFFGDWPIEPGGPLSRPEDEEMTLAEARSYIAREEEACRSVKASYHPTGAWLISIDCPYVAFNVIEEGGEHFGIGIVFAIADLKQL